MDWTQARERLQGPAFAPLAAVLAGLARDRWPTHAQMSAAAVGIVTASGRPVRFVPPRRASDPDRRPYEARIAATGEIETRAGNWHDLFNALAWIAYPRAKARINAQHAAMLAERGAAEARRRSPERDALTLFDEGGVVVLCADPALVGLVLEHRWKELFWHRRAALAANMRFLAFGHALFEKLLDPWLGIVAKSVLLDVDEAFLARPARALVAAADEALAAHLDDRAHFASPRRLPPLPVLGIPGWHADTGRETFYDDASHFRPRRGAPGESSKMAG